MIKSFLNLSLRAKLFLAPLMIVIAMLFLGYSSYQSISKQNDALSFLYNSSLSKKDTVSELRSAIIITNSGLYKALTWQGVGVKEDKINALLNQTVAQIKSIEGFVGALRHNYSYGAEEAAFLDQVEKGSAAYVKAARDTLEMIDSDPVLATSLLAEAERRYAVVEEAVTHWATFQKQGTDALFADTEAEAHRAITVFVIIIGVSLAVSLIVTLLISGVIASGIQGVTVVMNRLAGGDLTVEVPQVASQDEVGTMVQAVRVFKDTALEIERLRAEQERAQAKAEAMRIAAVEQMADKVELESRNAVSQVVAQTGDMTSKAESMAAIAFRVGTNSEEVAAAANQSLVNAQTVAAACEELTATISEIGRLVCEASSVTRSSVDSSRQTERTILSLSEAVGRIGEFTNLIADIAAQTNLLALNATIEAARAGAAGKGFAVVAGEVKALSNQAAKATEEITNKINEVRTITQNAVDSVSKVGSQILHIDEISSAVAAAIEEEGSATHEISRNVSETANAAQEVSRRIEQVATDAQTTMTMAMTVCEAASSVADNVGHLRSVLVQVVRTSTAEANRRHSTRYQVELPGCMVLGAHEQKVMVRDISVSGACLESAESLARGTRGLLVVVGCRYRLPFCVVSTNGASIHLKFDPKPGNQVDFCEFFDRSTNGRPLAA